MKIVNKIIRKAKWFWVEYKAKSNYDYCSEVFRNRLVKNGIPVNVPAPGEKEYIRFWQQFHKRVEPYTYRYFYRICGQNPHIVPEDIAYRFIEPVLNPVRYWAYYSDKNMYQYYIQPIASIPKVYLCRILGGLMYRSSLTRYNEVPVSFDLTGKEISEIIGRDVKKVVLKPSIDSSGGLGVVLFERIGEVFKNKDNIILSGSYLKKYGLNWVLQETIKPHSYLQQFSRSSVNTMRVMTYRSVVDDSVSVFCAVLRIGHDDSFVDNLTSGGGYVTINVKNGMLGKCIYNKYRQSTNIINNIDFSKRDFVLPFWQDVKVFAKNVAMQVPHVRLLAQDIVIDSENRPRLIEINVNNFSWSLSMSSGSIPFGDRFDEVINYCLKQKNNY